MLTLLQLHPAHGHSEKTQEFMRGICLPRTIDFDDMMFSSLKDTFNYNPSPTKSGLNNKEMLSHITRTSEVGSFWG